MQSLRDLFFSINPLAMKVNIEWEDQHHNWHHFQTVNHLPSAIRTAQSRARSTNKRHRLLNEDGALLDMFD